MVTDANTARRDTIGPVRTFLAGVHDVLLRDVSLRTHADNGGQRRFPSLEIQKRDFGELRGCADDHVPVLLFNRVSGMGRIWRDVMATD